jgi:hypothetical protein
MARFAPDSSRKTTRRRSTRASQSRKARRAAWTTGLSCSAGRGRFF